MSRYFGDRDVTEVLKTPNQTERNSENMGMV